MTPSFVEPLSIEEACGLLAADPWGAKALSGGTAVVLMMRQGLIAPDSLVSLARIAEIRGIERVGDVLRIGAGTTLAEVSTSEAVRSTAPSLAYACSVVGNPRIRNTATLGGNLAEADYASDPPATLASLGAQCRVVGPSGERVVPVADLITGFFETVLDDAELVTHVDVPAATSNRLAVYLKYRSRSSEDRACVGVAARADVVDGRVQDLDVVLAAVASTLQRFPELLASANGRTLDAQLAQDLARGYAEATRAMSDARGSSWYRGRMIEVFVRRAIQELERQQSQGGNRNG